MEKPSVIVCGLLVLIITTLAVGGCTDTAPSGTGAQVTATTVPGPLYAEGDIVKNPSSGAANAWIVLGYDAASDTYERALIQPNADGSWGYRMDTRTEHAGRAVMEKVYSEVVDNIAPSAVPVKTPTTVATMTTVAVTVTGTVAATTTEAKPPRIEKIIPDKGEAGAIVQVTDLVGDNFKNGANVSLSRAGTNEVRATGVRAVTPKSITCTFAIPADAPAGSYDVVVTNPDGQSDRYTNIFSVHRTPGAITTTYVDYAGTIPISYIDPAVGHVGDNQFVLTGSGFQNGATVKLQKTGFTDINARESLWNSATSMRCFIDIPTGNYGEWDLVVTNPDKTYGIKYKAYTIS